MDAINIDYRSSKLADDQVVSRVLGGQKELFEILLRRYNQTLYRVLRSYLQDENDVKDALQETYLNAFSKLCQFRGDATFSTWLIRIGINQALQRIKLAKKHRVVNLEDENGDLNSEHQLTDKNQMNPEKQMIQHETSMLVEKAMDGIPEKYRIVYMLREVEGMENSQISACLGLTESNVKVRFHRARKLLKGMLYKLSSEKEVFEFGESHCDRVVDYVMDHI